MHIISDIQVEDTRVFIEAGELTILVSTTCPYVGDMAGYFSEDDFYCDSDCLGCSVCRYSDEDYYGVRLLRGEDCGHKYRCDCAIDTSLLIGREIQDVEERSFSEVSFQVDGETYTIQAFDYTRGVSYGCCVDCQIQVVPI